MRVTKDHKNFLHLSWSKRGRKVAKRATRLVDMTTQTADSRTRDRFPETRTKRRESLIALLSAWTDTALPRARSS